MEKLVAVPSDTGSDTSGNREAAGFAKCWCREGDAPDWTSVPIRGRVALRAA